MERSFSYFTKWLRILGFEELSFVTIEWEWALRFDECLLNERTSKRQIRCDFFAIHQGGGNIAPQNLSPKSLVWLHFSGFRKLDPLVANISMVLIFHRFSSTIKLPRTPVYLVLFFVFARPIADTSWIPELQLAEASEVGIQHFKDAQTPRKTWGVLQVLGFDRMINDKLSS